ncbi:MAG: serine/threonine protein kinase, partial [Candidatus Obscuribacterales bacterium]|nr:serine/threonine protein kinase [Candidatus Obscuribacterales bacterium]
QDQTDAASDGKTDTSIKNIHAQEFKSTIFIPFSPGEVLPTTKTRVIKQLCSKPLCAVYLGRDENGRMVTIKQFYLPDDTEETKALSKLLKREYDLLSRLDHPGIAKVLDTFTVEKSTFLVIEHRLGTDLRETVQEHGPRSEALTLAWAQQLCEIMIHLHSQAPVILHRDLTPDNVIAGEDGQLRLIDFGAAREFLEGITGTMIGKHCYVAPEQLRGDATQRSDIYSFACTLYFLLTGRDPVALSQSSPARLIDCSDELSKLIEDCTEFDQDKRPQSFAEILNRLQAMDKGISLDLNTIKQKAFA